MFDMDKTRFAVGAVAQSTRVLTFVEGGKQNKANQASSGQQECVTLIRSISAPGKPLPPLVIFKGTTTIHEVDIKGWAWRVSNKGWSSDTITFDWLSNVFKPQTRPLPPLDPSTCRLLIIDSLGSNLKAQFIVCCMPHAINLAILLSHWSHFVAVRDIMCGNLYIRRICDS